MEGGGRIELNRLAALAALLLAACGGSALPPPVEIAPAGERALMRWGNGWRLSLAPPRFPYNQEKVIFDGMSGVGTGAPFGCGVESRPTGYFAIRRAPLVCATGRPDGALRVAPVGDDLHTRVLDAAPTRDGLTVVTARSGYVAVITVSPEGDIRRQTLLPDRGVDQAVILPSGRLVILRPEAEGCSWTTFDLTGEAPRQLSRTPADHAYQCHSANFARTVIRDQTTGEAYLHFDRPDPRRLYRIGEPGPDGPAVLAAADIAEGVPLTEGSDPRLLMINDGVLLFSAGRNETFGPRIGVRELAARRSGYVDLPGSGSPGPSANARILAFMAPAAPGGPPRVVLQHPRTGHSTIETIDVSAALDR